MAEPTDPNKINSIWERAEAKAAAHEAALGISGGDEPEGGASEGTQEAAQADAAPPAASKEKSKAEPKDEPAATGQTSEKRAQFDALARELGFSVDANAVTVNERVKWREEKRREKAKLDAERQAIDKYRDEADQTLTGKYGRAATALECFEKGDFDGVASALAGEKVSWKDLQGKAMQRLLSPEHRRIRELEEREQERERAAQQERAAAAEQARRAEIAEAQQQHRSMLTQEMGSSENAALKALSKQPMFVQAIMEIQGDCYRRGDALPTPEQALSMNYGGAPLIDNARALWQSLCEAFGNPAPSPQEADKKAGNRSAEDSARTGRKPKTVTRNGATEVSETAKSFDMRYWANQLRNADD